jgi:hypothetical protein
MLLAPSVAAVYVWAARPAAGDVNSDVLSSYYSFFMVVWGFVFLAFWQREANGLACAWDTLDLAHQEEPNPRFHGKRRRSAVTGEDEFHYESHWRWLIHYPTSALVTLLMLAVAFAVMSLSLNLQGYVNADSPIFVAVVAAQGEPGGWCDHTHVVLGNLPVLAHVVAIMALNTVRRRRRPFPSTFLSRCPQIAARGDPPLTATRAGLPRRRGVADAPGEPRVAARVRDVGGLQALPLRLL